MSKIVPLFYVSIVKSMRNKCKAMPKYIANYKNFPGTSIKFQEISSTGLLEKKANYTKSTSMYYVIYLQLLPRNVGHLHVVC